MNYYMCKEVDTVKNAHLQKRIRKSGLKRFELSNYISLNIYFATYIHVHMYIHYKFS